MGCWSCCSLPSPWFFYGWIRTMNPQRSPPTWPLARGLYGPKTGEQNRDQLLFQLLLLKLGQEGCGEKTEPIFLIPMCTFAF